MSVMFLLFCVYIGLGQAAISEVQRLNELEKVVALLNHTVASQYLSIHKQESIILLQKGTIEQLLTVNQNLVAESLQQTLAITELNKELKQQTQKMHEIANELQTIQGYYQQQNDTIIHLNAKMQFKGGGATYIRWGSTRCPDNDTELVYSGLAAGGHYGHMGSPAEPVCLPPDPDFGNKSSTLSRYSLLYGAEFDNNFFVQNTYNEGEDVTCAVCRVTMGSTVIMIPGKNTCYHGWKLEYSGYLAGNHFWDAAAGNYVCIDEHTELMLDGKNNDDGKIFVEVVAKCGSLHCPPYKENYPLTCSVCSK